MKMAAPTAAEGPLWALPVLGGSPVQLGGVVSGNAAWSPDGRYIVAMSANSHALMLFDFKTKKWSLLAKGSFAYPCWSRDSRYVYVNVPPRHAVDRVAIAGGKVEDVASLKGINTTGNLGPWLGLTADDAPTILKDAGSQEIVSMEWHEP
jgi:hypothetical protein